MSCCVREKPAIEETRNSMPYSEIPGKERKMNGESRYEFFPLEYGKEFTNVSDVAVDSKGNLFVMMRGETPVLVFDCNGRFKNSWGNGLFANPHGMHIDAQDHVYCVDANEHIVMKFTGSGELLMTLGNRGAPSDTGCIAGNFKTIKHGSGPFYRPTKVSTNKEGDIFVSDGYGNARVHRFAPDGTLIRSWGEPGRQPGQFQIPHGIAVDEKNNVYVADRENSRIQIFDIDGNLKGIWNNIYRPTAICVNKGFVFVSELGYRAYVDNVLFEPDGSGPWSQVRIFDSAGHEQAQIGGPEGAVAGNFFAAHSICVDREDNIYVGEVVWPANESKPPADLHQALQRFRKK
jgi:sugar lactone lactonase YvrE